MTPGDLRKEITPEIKANELLLQSQNDRRAFVIVEGKTDFRLFNEILSFDEWEVEYLSGKHNVIKCIDRMVETGLNRAVAVLDRDPYDESFAVCNAVYSENADLDSDMFAIDGLIDRLIKRNSNIRDVPVLRELGYESWREVVMSLVIPWTAVRDYASKNSLVYNFKDFPIDDIADSKTCEISIQDLGLIMLGRSQGKVGSSELEIALSTVDSASVTSCINGHHIARSIAWIVAKVLNSEKLSSTSIEDMARTGIGRSELNDLQILRDLDTWAHRVGKCVWGEHNLD